MKKKNDMHPADIVAAIKKRQTSLAELSRKVGLSSGTLANALKRPWPKASLLLRPHWECIRRRSGPAGTTINVGNCWRASGCCAIPVDLAGCRSQRMSIYSLNLKVSSARNNRIVMGRESAPDADVTASGAGDTISSP